MKTSLLFGLALCLATNMNAQVNRDLPSRTILRDPYTYERLPLFQAKPLDKRDLRGAMVAYWLRDSTTQTSNYTAMPLSCWGFVKRERDDPNAISIYLKDTTENPFDTIALKLIATDMDSAWKYCDNCCRVWRRSEFGQPMDGTFRIYTNIPNPELQEYPTQGLPSEFKWFGNREEDLRLQLIKLPPPTPTL